MSNHLLPSADVANAYVELRRRVIDFLRREEESVGDLPVMHCPGWTVKMTLSHLVGVPEDILSGNMAGVTTEQWTQTQVDRHREHSIAQLLTIWESTADSINAIVPRIPEPTNSQFVFDACAHEHDIRAAIGRPGARNAASVSVAAGFLRHMLSNQPDDAARNLLNISVSDFDFVRSLSGRRTFAQIAACGLDPEVVASFIARMPVSVPTDETSE